ncbi:MAG: hypothetical protein PHY46_01005 [Candidatus Omnitrophica bacterium]|nr:hypothetical protein [Candidatus Omnitrophota bacterium]MDD5355334.1 hypothetical protein [Candidatus Omnitrophota bacterium]
MGNQKEGFSNIKDGACYSGAYLSLEPQSSRGFDVLKMAKDTPVAATKATKAYLLRAKLHPYKAIQIFKQFFLPKNVPIDAIIGIPAIIPKIKGETHPFY